MSNGLINAIHLWPFSLGLGLLYCLLLLCSFCQSTHFHVFSKFHATTMTLSDARVEPFSAPILFIHKFQLMLGSPLTIPGRAQVEESSYSLSPVEAVRVTACLDEAVEKLAFLNTITPDVLAHRDELATLVGDEITALINEQKALEKEFYTSHFVSFFTVVAS
jgi:hypothetical protein